jgi:hypothetical protein
METWDNFLIKTDAKTINGTYELHQCDLDTMLHEGECAEDDEIIVNCTDGELDIFFTQGGSILDGKITDKKMIKNLFKNRNKL